MNVCPFTNSAPPSSKATPDKDSLHYFFNEDSIPSFTKNAATAACTNLDASNPPIITTPTSCDGHPDIWAAVLKEAGDNQDESVDCCLEPIPFELLAIGALVDPSDDQDESAPLENCCDNHAFTSSGEISLLGENKNELLYVDNNNQVGVPLLGKEYRPILSRHGSSPFPTLTVETSCNTGKRKRLSENDDDDYEPAKRVHLMLNLQFADSSSQVWLQDDVLIHVPGVNETEPSLLDEMNTDDTVGPESIQMKAIKRLIVYLMESPEEGAELVQPRPQVGEAETPRIAVPLQRLEHCCSVVQHCFMGYHQHQHKYLHLPGSIFDDLVETWGGQDFARLYTASRAFQHDRLKKLNLQEESEHHLMEEEIEASVSEDLSQPETEAEENKVLTPCSSPTNAEQLLAFAVSFGMHIASNRNAAAPIKVSPEVAQQAAVQIQKLNAWERQELWKQLAGSTEPSSPRK